MSMSMINFRNNKSRISLLLVFFMFLSIIAPGFLFNQTLYAAAINLAKNPGFETGTTSPEFWVPVAGFENLYVWDTETKYEGSKALKLYTSASTKRSIFDQPDIPVNANSKYLLSAYCRTENMQGDAKIELYFYDSAKNFITGGYKSLIMPKVLNDWTLESLGEMQAPAAAAYAKVRLMAMNGTGSVWYDNVSFTRVSAPEQLAYITAAAGSSTISIDETTNINVTGTLGSGSQADLSTATFAYVSDNPNVASVNNGVVTGVSAGTANIRISVTLGGITEITTVAVKVIGDILTVKYDFRAGVTATIETNGWRVEGSNASYRNQPYGIQVQSNNIGDYITMAINVPADGYYTLKFTGAGAGGGAISDLSLDDIFVGQIDFYSASYVPAQPAVLLKTLELSQGLHMFTIKAVGKSNSWGYNMYPGELVLAGQKSLPALETVVPSCTATELAAGQTASIKAVGIMSNGYTDVLRGSDVIKEFTSSDKAVATVDSNGAIKALKPGSVQITAKVTINSITKEASVPLTVNEKVLAAVEVVAEKSNIPVGISTKMSVVASLDDGTPINLRDAVVRFSSDNEAVATVDAKGNITAAAEGTANISVDVTLGVTTVSGQAQINVVPVMLDAITVTADKTSLFVGRQAKLTVTGQLNNGQDVDMSTAVVTYESSDPAVVQVGADGTVVAKAAGKAVITVSVSIGSITKTDSSISFAVASTEDIKNSKTKSTYYTAEKVAAARENIGKYDWARSIKDSAVESADKYVNQAELLWNMVTPQSIPRGILVNSSYTCPNCGKDLRSKYGNYPWLIDPVNAPWKVKCPDCGIMLPSNDFKSYYESGLDEHGLFDASLADKSLLVNTLYPEKGAGWGVDDGFGFKAADGSTNTFIAYYNHWGLWYSGGIIQKALNSLRDAYIYTGDVKYARTGIILLDRIADVYPEMTLDPYGAFLNSHGGTGKGKIIGSIWETDLVQSFITAYDAFFPAMNDQETINFLIGKSAEYDMDNPKNTSALICKNIEDGILRQVYPAVKAAQIRGNFGMHQAALALAAVVLDSNPETSKWLDFTFQAGGLVSGPYAVTGGDVMATLIDKVDRDGHGNEGAPGYNNLWLSQLKQVADALEGYEGYPGADLYQNPKFMKMFSAMYPLMLCERYMAQIGDSGGTGNPGLTLGISDSVAGFIKFGDPVLAQLAYFLNKSSSKGLHASIFTKDPEKVSLDIQQIINDKGELNLKSDNLAGYGFSVLRDGENYKPYFGYQIAFMSLSPYDSTAAFKLFESSGTMQFEAAAAGQSTSFKFIVPKTDYYEVDLNPFKAGSYGIYDVSIDGTKVATVDFYGGSGASSKLEVLSKMNLTEGEHTISFFGTGKNAASTGYKMGLIHLVLYDKAALAIKEDANNSDTQRDFWMYYGRTNTSHAHRDQLNLGVHAYGLDVAPDLGYPEETGDQPNRVEWVSNTVSHNTVVVDKSKQVEAYDGTPLHFDNTDAVKVIDVDSRKAYSNTEMYRRTVAMVKVDDDISYGVDFFRVKGGNDHYYSFHGAEGAVATEGLNLTAQATGTYAGTDVLFGQRADSVSGWGYVGSGFHWLKNVEKDTNPASVFSVDWDIVDGRGVLKEPADIHLRLTMLGDVDDVAIMDGQPPKVPGNPQWLKYMIAHRSGENLSSLFTAIIEPYKDARYIKSIAEVPVTVNGQAANEDVKAVKVTLESGRVDYIVNSIDSNTVYTVDGKFKFKGFLAVYSEKEGRLVNAYVNDGNIISLLEKPANITGTVKAFTKELSATNELTVEADGSGINAGNLAGRYIYVNNDGEQNAAYKILGVKEQNGNTITLNLGASTLIRKLIDSSDPGKGYVFNIAEGNKFSIPLSYNFPPDYEGVPQADIVKTDGTLLIGGGSISLKDGETLVKADKSNLSIAINNAVKAGMDKIEIYIPEGIDVTSLNMAIPASALKEALKKGIKRIIIVNSATRISFNPNALKNDIEDNSSIVNFVLAAAGSRGVYDFNIYVDGVKATKYSGSKAVELTLPYTPEQDGDVSTIIACRTDDDGKLKVIRQSFYDPGSKTITLRADYPGRYTIMQTQVP